MPENFLFVKVRDKISFYRLKAARINQNNLCISFKNFQTLCIRPFPSVSFQTKNSENTVAVPQFIDQEQDPKVIVAFRSFPCLALPFQV